MDSFPMKCCALKRLLTDAFRNQKTDSILLYSAHLAHYIGDAHVPLHVAVNYDGQLTNQKGLHSLWETMIPEIEINQYDLYDAHEAAYLSDPAQSIWAAIQNTQALVPGVFAEETAASTGFTDSTKHRIQIRKGKEYRSYTTAFEKAYNARLGNTINQQLLRSANLVADFWYTAWVDAGKPDLSHLLAKPFNSDDKRRLRDECKAYRDRELIQKKLLLSRQDQYSHE